MPNYTMLEAIAYQMNRFTTLPIIHKVKGHSGDILNDRADQLAKEARNIWS